MTDINARPFAVVTGGSNGIGLELARQFVDNGYDLLIAAQDEQHLRDAAAMLGAGGAQVATYAGDLGQEKRSTAYTAPLSMAAGRSIFCASMPASVSAERSSTPISTPSCR